MLSKRILFLVPAIAISIILAYTFFSVKYKPSKDVTIKDRFIAAIDNRDIHSVETLYNKYSAILQIQDSEYLHRASKNCAEDIVKYLIDNGANVNIKKGRHKSTALHVAAYNGCNSVLQLLLDNGANIDEANSQGETPLMHALEQGHIEIALFLIEHGSNVNVNSRIFGRPMDYAVKFKRFRAVKALLDKGAICKKASEIEIKKWKDEGII